MPRGFAHGFVVLSESVDFFYKCDELYSPSDELVVRWNDPTLGISWGNEQPTMSGRDAAAPLLADVLGFASMGMFNVILNGVRSHYHDGMSLLSRSFCAAAPVPACGRCRARRCRSSSCR